MYTSIHGHAKVPTRWCRHADVSVSTIRQVQVHAAAQQPQAVAPVHLHSRLPSQLLAVCSSSSAVCVVLRATHSWASWSPNARLIASPGILGSRKGVGRRDAARVRDVQGKQPCGGQVLCAVLLSQPSSSRE